MQKNRRKFFVIIPIAMLLLLPWVVMLLWNHIVADIFSIKVISYWQALGLFVLSRILFGRFGFGGGRRPPFGKPFFKERMMNMTEEERSRMKEEWKKRFQKSDDAVK